MRGDQTREHKSDSGEVIHHEYVEVRSKTRAYEDHDKPIKSPPDRQPKTCLPESYLAHLSLKLFAYHHPHLLTPSITPAPPTTPLPKGSSHIHFPPIHLRRPNLLPGLLDLLQHSFIRHIIRVHIRGLCCQVDGVAF